jgi:hypothetical protein
VINNDVTINGSQNTVVQGGQNRGAISASARTAAGSTRKVSALLAELRTKVAATDVDKRAVIDDNLDEDIRKAQGSGDRGRRSRGRHAQQVGEGQEPVGQAFAVHRDGDEDLRARPADVRRKLNRRPRESRPSG